MPINANQLHHDSLTAGERFAAHIASSVGSPSCYYLQLIWTVSWLMWNLFAPSPLRFDPLPACVLYLLITNILQGNLMPLLLVAANLQSRHDTQRADALYRLEQRLADDTDDIRRQIDSIAIACRLCTTRIPREALESLEYTFAAGDRPGRTLADAITADDHLAHARAHLDALAAGDVFEDHLAHACARLAMEITRRARKYCQK